MHVGSRWQTGLPDLVLEPLAEALWREWATVLRRQECQVFVGGRLDDRLQLGMQRDVEDYTGLLLPNLDGIVSDVLPTHLYDVRPPLTGIKGQCHGQTCASAYRV